MRKLSANGSSLDPSSLVAFQGQDPRAQRNAEPAVRQTIYGLAKKKSFRLPKDMAEDIVQEVFLLLLTRAPYDPLLAQPITYLYPLVQEAARTVKAAMAPPGQRTRPQPVADSQSTATTQLSVPHLATEDISMEEIADSAGVKQIDAQVEVALLRRTLARSSASEAWAAVEQAVSMVYETEASWTEAAATAGVSKDALYRLRKRLVQRFDPDLVSV